jgi:hypothetical protein
MNKKEEVRDKIIVIRVTQKEKMQIEENAKKTGLAVSEFGRQFMLEGKIWVSSKEEISENSFNGIDRRTLYGIANNLNQLTRYAHENRVMPQISELLEKIEKIIEK